VNHLVWYGMTLTGGNPNIGEDPEAGGTTRQQQLLISGLQEHSHAHVYPTAEGLGRQGDCL